MVGDLFSRPTYLRKRRVHMNALHSAFRGGAECEEEQLRLIGAEPSLLEQEDDSWEGWLPLHNAARWGATKRATEAALAAFPEGAKSSSKGGYEPLHLAAMGGHQGCVQALLALYPEGAFKKDNNGRTPLDEARECDHAPIASLILELPGAREMDAAEQQLRAARAAELLGEEPPDAGEEEEDQQAMETGADGDEDDENSAARSLANRMLRAASSALWRREEDGQSKPLASRQQLGHFFSERAKYIPLRLELKERRMLRLIEGVLGVSEYTDRIDDPAVAKSAPKRRQSMMREVHALLSGMLLAVDYDAGQRLLQNHEYVEFEGAFQQFFETVRRYKIMNPEKMRETYGKLLYWLQDANSAEAREELEISPVLPIRTVHTRLEEAGCLELLQDARLGVATQVVAPTPGKSRATIQREIRAKESAIEQLARRYSCAALPAEELRQCLYSIGDNNAYLYQARDPIDRVLVYLTELFPATEPTAETSLAIAQGQGGARLSHSHARQYAFVLQSLSLWREIANDMFRLWCLAEEDLLDAGNGYELRDTGQGLQRVQHAPRTSRAMQQLLARVQAKSGGWVGSSLVHLGDSNVPNALMFIDKYSQIEYILNPILATIDALPVLHEKDAHVARWIDRAYGSVSKLRLAILADFFRYGFDGSGADNFFDAGSCIDGRLTSAWHWCSQLPQKPFYTVFRLAGFTSFDGQFQS